MTPGEPAGTQTFDSIRDTDVMIVVGANPTDAHPVFGSAMRRRLREGAELIVIDPAKLTCSKLPGLGAHHLPLKPGTNVAMINAIAHVIVTEGHEDQDFIAARCDQTAYNNGATSFLMSVTAPRRCKSTPVSKRS